MTSYSITKTGWTAIFRTGGSGIVTIVRTVKSIFTLALRTPAGRIGLPIVLIHLILALFGNWLAPYDPLEQHLEHQLEAPSWQFLMGTDVYGQDILSRVMGGAGSIIGISVAGALLGIALGTIVGMGSGYKGGKTDEVIMRIMDGLMSFPSLLMALLVLTIFASSEIGQRLPEEGWIILTIGIVFMPPVSRVMRSTTLALKTQEFVQSARMRGEPAPYIIFREILPNTWSVLAVELSVRLSYAILLASSLGFLGLGAGPNSPDWGRMISDSRIFIVDYPWVALAPAFAVSSLIIGVNLLTDGVQQARRLPQKGIHP